MKMHVVYDVFWCIVYGYRMTSYSNIIRFIYHSRKCSSLVDRRLEKTEKTKLSIHFSCIVHSRIKVTIYLDWNLHFILKAILNTVWNTFFSLQLHLAIAILASDEHLSVIIATLNRFRTDGCNFHPVILLIVFA